MSEAYITLDELKESYLGDWDDDNDRWAEKQIQLAGAHLRAEFKSYGRDLDEEIAEDNVDHIAVESVISAMVLRKLSQESMPFGGGFTQFGESADGYSINVTASSRFSSMYLRRDEKRLLGLPLMRTGSIKIVL